MHRSVLASAIVCLLAGMNVPVRTAAMTVSEVIDHRDPGHLDSPWGIVADTDGTVYVAGVGSNDVLARAPDGTVDVVLDASGGGTGHRVDLPQELAIAPDGTLYVAAVGSVNVFKRPRGGAWSQILDASGDGAGHPLEYANGLAADAAGNAFVGDPATNTVFRIDAAGTVTVVLDATGDGMGNTLDGPDALVTDSAGNLYVTGNGSDNVFMVTPAGAVSVVLADTPSHAVDAPTSLAVDAAGNVYVGSSGNSRIWRVEPGGNATVVASSIIAIALAVRSDGVLFVADGSGVGRAIRGLRQYPAPNCTAIDQAGDGTTPFGFATRFALTPGGDLFASNDGYDDVFMVQDACTGPTIDFTGRWYLTITGNGGASTVVQDWVQSGFQLTVTDPATAATTFTGMVDDANHIDLRSTANICIGNFPSQLCCEAQTLVGDPTYDGFGWTGSLSDNAFFLVTHCGPYETFSVVANHCGNGVIDPGEGCEDGNDVAGDGCDPTCRVEPCYVCSGNPSVCEVGPRVCSGSTKSGGVSLQMKAAAGSHFGSLRWKLTHGAGVDPSVLGDPRTHTEYSVCLFDRSQATPQLTFKAAVPVGASWTRVASRGFSYHATSGGAPGGIDKLLVQTGTKTKISLTGSGAALQLPALPLPVPLTVQLQTNDGGCFEASYSSAGALRNDAAQVRFQADP